MSVPEALGAGGRPWAPVAALAITTSTGYGVLYYAYGVLLVPMQEDLGWSRAFLSGALSLALVVAAVATIPVGRWLDRNPPRRLFVGGALGTPLLVLAWANARTPAWFVATWLLIGLGQAVLFYEPAFTVLAKRFDGRARSKAITTVTLVGGLASTVFAPLTAALERELGWRGAVAVLAGLLLAVAAPLLWWGLHPRHDTGPGEPEPDAPPAVHGMPFREAARSKGFVVLTTAYLLTAMTTFAVPVHLVGYLRERGMASQTAAAVLGAVGLVQVVGRGSFVRLTARRMALHVATGVLVAKSLGLVLLVVLPLGPAAVAVIVVYGTANGIATLTRALTLAELYGPTHYGVISAVVGAVAALGGALAPVAAAALIDVSGPGPTFLTLACLSLVAAALNEVVGRPLRSGRVAEAVPIGEA